MSLRVGLLCHDGMGGSARVAVDLGIALGTRGHSVHLFTRRAPFGLPRAPGGLALHTLDAGGENGAINPALDADWAPEEVDALAERVASVAQAARLDVLHFHYALPFAWVAEGVRARLGDAAPSLVGTLHGTDVSVLGRRPETRTALAEALGRLDALTTVSHDHAALAAETFGLAAAPEVIPNFVDPARFIAAPASSRARRPRVVHVSNFRPVKQPLAAARIYCEVRSRIDAELWLVGDGEGMPAVRGLLDEAGRAADTRRFGLRLDVERILPQADVLLLSSRAESFSMAALEASACGLAVVAPRVGGLAETVLDGETGLLYEPGDEAQAAAAVVELLADPALRRRMGAAGAWHARQLSTAAVVPRYEAVYRRVLRVRGASVSLEAAPAA